MVKSGMKFFPAGQRTKSRVALSEDIVQLILDDLIAGMTPKQLAWKWRLTQQMISKLKIERLEVVLRRKQTQLKFNFGDDK